ncbi:BamA/TamA family outer membrane protein [Formosa sp. 3Alg 14/1]|uniref:BamA/TamA family outer membrane protein n=1 Tax=Formosa sp. 3Alg 14/1 TaxID=3382190 RepID=UPI0039BDB99B
MKLTLLRVIVLTVFCFATSNSFAQDITKPTKKEAKEAKKAAKKAKKEAPPEKGTIYFSPVPVIGANPAFGFIYGAGASVSGFLGEPETTKISNALLGVAFTTKSQTIITLKSTIYGEDNNFIALGDIRYLQSSQPTWGLGTGPQTSKLASNDFGFDDGSIEGNSEADMLEFNFFRFYQTYLKKVSDKGFYVGLGLRLDFFSKFEDQLLDLDAETPVITPFYAYNEHYGFDQDKSSLVGLSLNGVLDTRDNVNNPYKGRYAMATFTVNPEFLGSDQSSTQLWLEYRDYINIKETNNDIIAIWSYANLTTSGDLPYMNLPAIGWDQYSKSGEPYSQGRFRGQNLLYLGAEYRKHLYGSKKNDRLLGMVVYGNLTTASAKQSDIGLLEYIEPGYGLGLRVNISKKARTNIGIDYGWGSYGSKGLFLRLNENF